MWRGDIGAGILKAFMIVATSSRKRGMADMYSISSSKCNVGIGRECKVSFVACSPQREVAAAGISVYAWGEVGEARYKL